MIVTILEIIGALGITSGAWALSKAARLVTDAVTSLTAQANLLATQALNTTGHMALLSDSVSTLRKDLSFPDDTYKFLEGDGT